jgi:hypothetical protein
MKTNTTSLNPPNLPQNTASNTNPLATSPISTSLPPSLSLFNCNIAEDDDGIRRWNDRVTEDEEGEMIKRDREMSEAENIRMRRSDWDGKLMGPGY